MIDTGQYYFLRSELRRVDIPPGSLALWPKLTVRPVAPRRRDYLNWPDFHESNRDRHCRRSYGRVYARRQAATERVPREGTCVFEASFRMREAKPILSIVSRAIDRAGRTRMGSSG